MRLCVGRGGGGGGGIVKRKERGLNQRISTSGNGAYFHGKCYIFDGVVFFLNIFTSWCGAFLELLESLYQILCGR